MQKEKVIVSHPQYKDLTFTIPQKDSVVVLNFNGKDLSEVQAITFGKNPKELKDKRKKLIFSLIVFKIEVLQVCIKTLNKEF